MQPTSEKPQSGKRSQFVVVVIVIRRTRTKIWQDIVTVRVVAARFVAHDVHDSGVGEMHIGCVQCKHMQHHVA